jgi:SAM-dependent methyltransferase
MAGADGVPVDEEVRIYYEERRDERDRLTEGAGLLELLRTQDVLRRHLPLAPARVLDVGGAAGVHAAWLAAEGYDVHLIDPVPLHVEQAHRAAADGAPFTAAVGDARRLDEPTRSADVVLLLGPLYHLPDTDDRLRALAEARRVVRPGGVVVAAGISRFASLLDGLVRRFLLDPEFREVVENDLRVGTHRNPARRPDWFTTAYFHHPDELRAEAEAAGLAVREVVGLEGLGGWLPDLADRLADPAEREIVLAVAEAVESEPALLGLSAHLLLVAGRPA